MARKRYFCLHWNCEYSLKWGKICQILIFISHFSLKNFETGTVIAKKRRRWEIRESRKFLLDIVNSMVLGYNMKKSKDFRVAVICSSNQNRSMEAHSFLRLFKFIPLVLFLRSPVHWFLQTRRINWSNWKYVSCGK